MAREERAAQEAAERAARESSAERAAREAAERAARESAERAAREAAERAASAERLHVRDPASGGGTRQGWRASSRLEAVLPRPRV
jgi:membrane protein involved in colicin uptake